MKGKKRGLFLLVVIVLGAVGLLHYSLKIHGDSEFGMLECYDPNIADSGYFVEFSDIEKPSMSLGSITFAGKNILAKYKCEGMEGKDNLAYSCFDPDLADSGFIVNVMDTLEDGKQNDNRRTEVDVLKVNFSGLQKLAKLPCYNKN